MPGTDRSMVAQYYAVACSLSSTSQPDSTSKDDTLDLTNNLADMALTEQAVEKGLLETDRLSQEMSILDIEDYDLAMEVGTSSDDVQDLDRLMSEFLISNFQV